MNELDGVSIQEDGCSDRASSMAGAVPQAVPATLFCKHGHAFTPENTIWQGKKRQCRECKRLTAKRWRFKMKLARPVRTRFDLCQNMRSPVGRTHPLFREMFEIADASRVSMTELSETTGHGRSNIYRARVGKSNLSVAALVDCFNALGYDLVPVKRAKQ